MKSCQNENWHNLKRNNRLANCREQALPITSSKILHSVRIYVMKYSPYSCNVYSDTSTSIWCRFDLAITFTDLDEFIWFSLYSCILLRLCVSNNTNTTGIAIENWNAWSSLEFLVWRYFFQNFLKMKCLQLCCNGVKRIHAFFLLLKVDIA